LNLLVLFLIGSPCKLIFYPLTSHLCFRFHPKITARIDFAERGTEKIYAWMI
jgi:hypothetical protein